MNENISNALDERKVVYDFYNFYKSRIKTDYEILLDQAKVEMESIGLAEERKKAERETKLNENVRGSGSVRRSGR